MAPEDRIRAELEFIGLEVKSIGPMRITIHQGDAPDLCVMRWQGRPLSEVVDVARKSARIKTAV